MKSQLPGSLSTHLPIKRGLKFTYILSFIIALLMTAVSLGGLLFSSTFYSTDEMRQAFLGNDVVNLLIGLPILLVSMWLTKREKLAGLLCWPGAMLYVVYNYLVYLLGMSFSWLTIVYFALVGLGAYAMVALLKSIDQASVKEKLTGVVPVKTTSWILLLFGVMFFFRAIGILGQAVIIQTMLPPPEVGLLIADLIGSLLWIAGGALLLRNKPLGYASGFGLLFAICALFVGLIVVLLLQPFLTGAPFVPVDVIVVFIMGLVCFVPFALFLRGVVSRT